MSRILRSWIDTTNEVVGILGGVASVVIAIVAIVIQQGIHDSDERRSQVDRAIAEQRAQVDRAIALFEQFASSEAVNHLTTLSGFVEFEIHKHEPDPEKTDKNKQLSAQLTALRIREDADFHDRMIQLLQQIGAIARCGDFMADSEDAICDQKTLFALFGESIVDLFFRLRPVMYCDSYFHNFQSDIASFETIVSTYLEEVKGTKRKIYRTLKEVPRVEREEDNYIVLEFGPQAFCQPFQDQQHVSLVRSQS